MSRGRVLVLLLAGLLAVLCLVFFRRSPAETEVRSAPLTTIPQTAPAQESEAKAPRTPAPAPAAAAEAKPPRTPEEIRKSILAKADKTLAENLGGLDESSRAELQKRIEELNALYKGGMGPTHPGSVAGLARISAYLDLLSAYQDEEIREQMDAYLQKCIQELDESKLEPAELVARWKRELSRDDNFQAVLLMGLEGRLVQGLRRELEFRRSSFVKKP